MSITALDLFAGTGWGVACQRLGIEEQGVELMPEAVQTRTANGMSTVYNDVWEGILLDAPTHEILYGAYDLLIASPPCQTFSAAGNGAGRKALNEVIEAIQVHAYKDPAELLAFGERHDMRTALVLTPLAYVWRDRPRFVAMEQVPTVLPVWEECAEVMRGWGYSVKVAVLNAEQYGVPQTRRRAILVASLEGEAQLPTPTHSRYYSRNPKKLDPGVLKWVSMAEALGWGRKDAPVHTIAAGTHGPTDRWASGGNGVRRTMDKKVGTADWITKPAAQAEGRTTYAERFDIEDVSTLQTYPRIFQNGNQPNATQRHQGEPAPTVCFGHNAARIEWVSPEQAALREASGHQVSVEEAAALQTYPSGLVGFPRLSDGGAEVALDGVAYRARDLRDAEHPSQVVTEKARSWKRYGPAGTERLSTDEAAALQTYPVFRNGNQANAARRPLDAPAPTVHFGARANKVEWMDAEAAKDPAASGELVTVDQAAALQTYPAELRQPIQDWKWKDAPATTIAGDPRITAREHHYHGEQSKTSLKLTQDEAHTLQTFPEEPPFTWCGTKSKVFLQIGNAVPPLLAQHILATLVPVDELL